jgi:solute carrier family 50 protein (sugar transporter)
MVDSTVLLVVRIFAGMGVLALSCSPSMVMRQIHKQKHVGVASVIPLVMLLVNSHTWMLYGYMAENYFPIFSCFGFGDLAALAYIVVYWRYTTERRYVNRVIAVTMAVFTILSIYAIVGGLGYTGQTRAQVGKTLGYIGDATAICLYSSPMEKLVQVLKHKSAIFINAPMVMASLANNIMWFTYGVLMSNWIIFGPNILFMALNSYTLVLCIVYNPKTHPLRESFFAGNGDNAQIEVSIDVSPKAGNKVVLNTLRPEYKAMQSPLEPLHLQLDKN